MPISILDRIAEQESRLQEVIDSKLLKGEMLTDEEVRNYKLTDKDIQVMDIFNKMASGNSISGFSFNDFLASPQAKVLVPRVIIGTMKKAADPMYLASEFFKKIRMKSGQAIMFPSIGVMKAYDVAEGQEINGVSLA